MGSPVCLRSINRRDFRPVIGHNRSEGKLNAGKSRPDGKPQNSPELLDGSAKGGRLLSLEKQQF